MSRVKLKPILNDVEVRTAEGRFAVQLEIPSTSTLTPREIDRVLEVSSWTSDPNTAADGYEGIRSVLLQREVPIVKGGIEMGGIQVSGIGHCEFDFSTPLPTVSNTGAFSPPSLENYIGLTPGTLMSSSYAEGKKIISYRPDYRALGTYTTPELLEKIRNTNEISEIQLGKLIVPHVEAYGRYLDNSLQNEDGPFGFVIFPVPNLDRKRVMNDFLNKFVEAIKRANPIERGMIFMDEFIPYLAPIAESLRELHDEGRVSHLQAHLENFYVVGGNAYLVDWTTMRRLGGDAEGNVRNRVIDLKRPADDFSQVFQKLFQGFPEEYLMGMAITIAELTMAIYSGHSERKIDLFGLYHAKPKSTEFDIIVDWMKDQGIEGFEKKQLKKSARVEEGSVFSNAKTLKGTTIRNDTQKVGRNEPCNCGSGKKYKFCHGSN